MSFLLLMPPAAHAETPQETRAQHLFTEVRCVVCQGESIADSDAAIAADMRSEIRADIGRGMSDREIRDSLYKRYGDYVLFRPRLSKLNLLLWLIPPLVALGGILWLVLRARKPVKTEISPLTSEEREKLADVLED
ncbi:MAG: cytochrome c-type biogenesis protein [Asticcacaulis sp.]